MEEKVTMSEVRELYDLDYYIKEVRKAEKRSHGLWRPVCSRIREILEEAKKKGTPLLDIADILTEEAGEEKKGEPVSLSVYRNVAKAILIRQKVCLL